MKAITVILLFLFSIASAVEAPRKLNLNRDKQFIAGVVILEHSEKYLTNMETNVYMKELLRITDLTPKAARKILEKYKGRPERFRKTLEQIEDELRGKKNGK